MENAVGFGINELYDLGISKLDLLKMSQKAEHEFARVRCGIMDQFASMMGEKNRAILLDCKTLDYSIFPLEMEDYKLLLCNSNVRHNLASSEYNIRRAQCEEGVSILQTYYPKVTSLREVTFEMLQEHREEFDETVLKRCEYVLEENNRVQQFGDCLNRADFTAAGHLLYEGHEGMRSKYEISCQEIDFLVDFTRDKEGILGARMMGGGFGGCTLNLIHRNYVDLFISELSHQYLETWGVKFSPIHVEISAGVSIVY